MENYFFHSRLVRSDNDSLCIFERRDTRLLLVVSENYRSDSGRGIFDDYFENFIAKVLYSMFAYGKQCESNKAGQKNPACEMLINPIGSEEFVAAGISFFISNVILDWPANKQTILTTPQTQGVSL